MDGSISLITRVTMGGGHLPVAIDAAGNLYHPAVVPRTDGWSILRRTPKGDVDCIASGFLQIIGLAADDEGRLFVADAELNLDQGVLLSVPTERGESIKVLACEDGIRPHAVAVGRSGSVFFSSVRGVNSDTGEIFEVDPSGRIGLVADGLVQTLGLAYDAKNDVLYALDFLNFVQDQSAIPEEYHNDTLILLIRGDGQRVPAPFYQTSSPVKLLSPRRSRKYGLSETAVLPGMLIEAEDSRTSLALPRIKVSSYVASDSLTELTTRIVAWKKRFSENGLLRGSFLSDQAIERLIDVAYHASCLEEEGRFPRFRILAGTNWLSGYCVQLWPFPMYVNQAAELRKLASAAAFRGSALIFDDESSDGQQSLVCRGIYDTEEVVSTKAAASNSVEDFLVIKQPVLAIRVEGPAYLKASLLPGPVFSLRGGTIRQLNSLEEVPCVQELFSEVGERQHEHLRDGGDTRVRTFFGSPDILGRLIGRMWSRVLWHVSERRRGGTFVIIPRCKGHWRHAGELDIALSYRAKVDFGRLLIDQVVSCLATTPSSGPGYGRIFQLTWERSRGERERTIRMVADLANVDGCVVLDRRLNVVGFGGKIAISAGQVKGFGTRHASALAWCSRNEGGIAFVVSQDGDLRVFSSDSSSILDVVDAGASILEVC